MIRRTFLGLLGSIGVCSVVPVVTKDKRRLSDDDIKYALVLWASALRRNRKRATVWYKSDRGHIEFIFGAVSWNVRNDGGYKLTDIPDLDRSCIQCLIDLDHMEASTDWQFRFQPYLRRLI